MTGRDAATLAQLRAARPLVSTWVGANAGSGKTRVLTDRVARLLLRGVDPQRILCLTYTKAAAAEMQNRLFERLGTWAMRPESNLREDLAALDEDASGISDADLAQARRLFAGALEAPGGLKIQTIHSFCEALLRRFPLEAGVSPQFAVLEERQARQLREGLLERLAQDPRSGFQDLAALAPTLESAHDAILRAILTMRERFSLDPQGEGLPRSFGLGSETPDFVGAVTTADLGELIAAYAEVGGVKEKARLPLLYALRGDAGAGVPDHRLLLRQDGTAAAVKPTKAVAAQMSDAPRVLEAVQARCLLIEDHQRLTRTVATARVLTRFGARFITAYDAAKRDLGALDFDDLIRLAGALLNTREASAWVTYKLDGGIDHVLVDEAQDTSPAQWQVVDAAVAEFFAGQSARGEPRTLFVVGDLKQSIYSFQGAEPVTFENQATKYAARLNDIHQELERCDLLYSFRSAPAILSLVDAVSEAAEQRAARDAQHRAFHEQMPGRVELWPFEPAAEAPDPPDPWAPVVEESPPAPEVVLGRRIARHLAGLLNANTPLPGTGRALRAGDILILVRKRGLLFHTILNSLKAEAVPVAGADRLKLRDEIAVRDIIALLSAVACGQDDLSLAAALRSPIFGLSEAALYDLAHERDGPLAQAVLHAGGLAAEILGDLRNRADYLRPYELIDRLLIRHGARARFAARLGVEAEEAVSALLDLALEYERVEAPTLTGFLNWLASDDPERKRQLEGASGEVRVMTVHGAKGLEAPMVILPDTVSQVQGQGGPLRKVGARAVALAGSEATRPRIVADEDRQRKALEEEEHARLLYVAMTRAERWLLVCGAGTRAPQPQSWYARIAEAMARLGSVEDAGTLVLAQNWEEPSTGQAIPEAPHPDAADLPDWLNAPAPPVPAARKPLAPSTAAASLAQSWPSRPQGGGRDPEVARREGIWLHALLEHLPGMPPAEWPEVAARLMDGAEAPDIAALLARAGDVINAPELSWIFAEGSLAEVTIAGTVTTLAGAPMGGVIDRLVQQGSTLWIIDYKSDATPPAADAPLSQAYAMQLALYVAALREGNPAHEIRAAILWTQTGQLQEVDHEDVTRLLQSLPAH